MYSTICHIIGAESMSEANTKTFEDNKKLTALFTQIFGANKDAQAIVDALNEVLPTFGINTTDRIAAFLAQAGHESAKFTAKVENLIS